MARARARGFGEILGVANFSSLIPELQPWATKLLDLAVRAGVRPQVTSTYRTLQQQTKLYDQFLAGQSKYPVAPPGTSAHEFGYAFDLAVDNSTDLTDLGTVWEQWGGVYGGRFGDPVHFEYPGFSPGVRPQAVASPAPSSCGTTEKLLAEAVDFILGLLPYIGTVELVAWLVGMGFPRSQVLQWLNNPVTGTLCGLS